MCKGLFGLLGFFCETVKAMTSFGALCWQAGLARGSPLTCVSRTIDSRWCSAHASLSDLEADNGLLHPVLKLPHTAVSVQAASTKGRLPGRAKGRHHPRTLKLDLPGRLEWACSPHVSPPEH